MASIRRCRRMNSARKPSRACSIAPMTASSISWPAISSLILAANRPLLTSPTLSPKPRKIPRMLSSTSRSLLCSSLRPTSSALISCAGADLRCTGRYQPIRKSWAMSRASLPRGPRAASRLGWAVGLDDHRRERCLHVPGLEQHRLGQAGVQLLRQGSDLEPDPGQRQAEPPEEIDERLRLARHLRLTD